jgi:hypothetical protein
MKPKPLKLASTTLSASLLTETYRAGMEGAMLVPHVSFEYPQPPRPVGHLVTITAVTTMTPSVGFVALSK